MKNIILTGLMGSGKSSVGALIKEYLPDFELIETDFLIVQKEGMTINKIFEEKGEKYFRNTEKSIVDALLKKENQIISLGGGSLENDFDFEAAKRNSVLFYLKADVEILYERIKNKKDRPLLKCENPKQKLEDLLDIREKNYMRADYIVEVNTLTIKETAEKIIGFYKNETRNY